MNLLDLFTALGSVAALVSPVIIFVALMMIWRDVRRIADALSPEDEYYYEDEYDEEDEEYDEEEEEEVPPAKTKSGSSSKSSSASKGKGKGKGKPGDEDYAPGEHMEDGVLDLERE